MIASLLRNLAVWASRTADRIDPPQSLNMDWLRHEAEPFGPRPTSISEHIAETERAESLASRSISNEIDMLNASHRVTAFARKLAALKGEK